MVVPNHVRLLYYFAPLDGVAELVAAGRLPVDRAVAPRRASRLWRRPPPLLWLSDLAELAPEQEQGDAAVRPGLRATADGLARVAVSVSDAQYWPRWADKHGIRRRLQRELDDGAAGLSGRWWVVSRQVVRDEWLYIDAVTGGELWRATDAPVRRPVTRSAGRRR